MPIVIAPDIFIDEENVRLTIRGPSNQLRVEYSTLNDYLARSKHMVNDGFRRLTEVINAIEGSAIVAQSLPDPSMAYQGRFVLVSVGGATPDVLYQCQWDGAAYSWVSIP